MDETKVKDVFAAHIMKLRKNRHMTQGDFAELLEVGVSTVSDWETGKKLPRAGVIERIARTFNVSKSSLFEEEGQNKNSDPLANEKEFDPFMIFDLVDKYSDDQIIEKFYHTNEDGKIDEATVRMHLSHVRFLKGQK